MREIMNEEWHRQLVERLVAEAPEERGPRMQAVADALDGVDCAALVRALREDPETSFVVYDFPRGVCAKPRELAISLLDALVVELREERGARGEGAQ